MSLAQEDVPSHRSGPATGRKCLVGQRDTLHWRLLVLGMCCGLTHCIPAKGLKVESAQQTEKPQEPQCLPAALTVQAVTPQ